MSAPTLTGELTRRVRKYNTEEERQEGKLRAYRKYAAKKYYCEICDKTMTLHNYSRHIESLGHLERILSYNDSSNK